MSKARSKSKQKVVKLKALNFRKVAAASLVFACIASALLYYVQAASTITAISTITPAAEGSGMVASRQYPGIYWWHRDGGPATTEKPRDAIYAIKFDANGQPQPVRGTDKFPSYLIDGPTNNNWEDIAIDDNNNIWIGDIGANDCGRNNQRLLKIKEPNPTGTETLTVLANYTFKFPDPASGCNTWNSEAMFWLDGKMYIFAKTSGSPVYRVDMPTGSSGTATLTRLGTLSGGVSNISVSSLSDDRSRLMVASHGMMRIYKTSNTSLKGDALVKDLISRSPAYTASFDCNCVDKNPTVEGGSFKRNSYDVAFVSENKFIYYGKPVNYGDSSTTPPPPTNDTIAPSVNITSPTDGENVSGTIVIEVTASDNVAVTQVRIQYDGNNLIREGTAQGSFGWGSAFDTWRISDGTHTFSAEAFDAAGNMSTSQVSVNVRNSAVAIDTTPPTVTITSPSSGQTVSGTIVIGVDANDNVGVTAVNVYYDGNNLIRRGTAQGVNGWGSAFDTRVISNGNHTFNVEAFDAAGNTSTSQVSVMISNVSSEPPPDSKPGDVNGDDSINLLDLSILLTNWAKTSMNRSMGDLNEDGLVNLVDLSILLNSWGS